MPDSGENQPEASAPLGFDRAMALRFNRFAGGFWTGESARLAWRLTAALAGCLVLKLLVDVATNHWNRWFFDALERRDAWAAASAVGAFGGLFLCVAAVGVGIVLSRERLQVRWREWCTARLLDGWLSNQRFYRLTAADSPMQNPEYRISDDVRMATEPLTDFAIGLFTAVLAAATFAGILWSVGGSLNVSLGGYALTIPAFMVLGAIAYGTVMSALIPVVGRRLSGAAAAKNEAEARFRFEMIRLRENAEGVIMARGETDARRRLGSTYSDLVRTWMAVVRQHGNVTWVMNANGALVPVVPLVLCAPKYLSGDLTLGEVMQLASAFAQVQVAISWLVDNYRGIAEWFASARRVVELEESYQAIDASTAAGQSQVVRGDSPGDDIRLEGLQLTDQTGRVVMDSADVTIRHGSKVWLGGDAGAGKSVLVRAIAGLWGWGAGSILTPAGRSLNILSSTPFLPSGSLRETLTYPQPPNGETAEDLRAALNACGLERLTERLDDVARWDQALSASERQRLAFARLFVQRPDIVILEDALSPFDEASQGLMLDALFAACPHATILLVGARPPAPERFQRHLYLQKSSEGENVLVETGPAARPALAAVS
ncbi:MAG: transporter ATP-binding protein [Hyphomicrobiales bacterium]|nr:transporter ATP-binding protein [Hyphomicrobiales bacterium]